LATTAYFEVEPLVVPVDDAPVVPDVVDPLEVPALPLDDGVLDDGVVADEPLEEPMPDDEPDTEEPDEPLVDGDVALLLVDGELDDGDTDPVAEPVDDPMPEAEPEAVPEALGPVELHAASVNAQANGTIHFIIVHS
jgi:hypothetical protein